MVDHTARHLSELPF
jgi:hypothetical protein